MYEGRFSGTISRPSQTVLATGFIASFTKYSTFVVDALRAEPTVALVYLGTSYILGFGAVLLGREGARWIAAAASPASRCPSEGAGTSPRNGGAIGAILRFAVGRWIQSDRFPYATLVVNGIGSFVLAGITAMGSGNEMMLFVGVGLCGSFTTYSSFSVETVVLWETDERSRAIAYAVGTLVLCVAAAVIAVGLVWIASD